MHDTQENLRMARCIAEAVAAAGGRSYFVGGCVRDRLMSGAVSKDVDVEVHGVSPENLAAILDTLGERTVMGASFGVFGLKHYDLDIAMPRSEKATGRGHRDFEIYVDPFIGPEKAARRRDFTVNALMEDILTGEVLDFFGGIEDMKRGVLRHVNDDSFAEDPLRVLRAAQFAARFGFAPAPETVALCRTMDLTALARERVFGEMEKALLKAEKPSVFFQVLREMDALDFWFPEVKALIGVIQPPQWHPEGDVWNHTMLVLDEAAKLRSQTAEPLVLMLAALCHDLGKALTTTVEPDGRIRAIGHEREGLPLVRQLLERLTGAEKLLKGVPPLVELHMQPNQLVNQHSGKKAYMRLFDRAPDPDMLVLLARADAQGCAYAHDYEPDAAVLREMLTAYRELTALPEVRGADLIQAGIRPGPRFSELLAYTHRLHLSGVSREEALAAAVAMAARQEKKA